MRTLDHTRALVRGFIDGTLSENEHAALEMHLRDPAVARHLLGLARRIGGRQVMLRLQHPDPLGAAEPLGQHVDDRRVDIVDAVAQRLQLGQRRGGGLTHGIAHALGHDGVLCTTTAPTR